MTRRSAGCAALAAVFALCSGAVAHASVFVGHSGWFWANPLPQGNTLRALDFAGTRGYAAGDFGTVMRSDDGGATWAGLITGATVPLRLVRAVSRDVVVVAGKCVVRRSDDGGASFTTLPWTPAGGACRRQVASLAFPSTQNGYLLLSDGSVLHTHDGGRSWTARTAIPGTAATTPGSSVHPTDTFFPAADAGFVTTDGGAIYRTSDGGTSWSPVAQAPQHLDSVYFADAQTGFAVGGASVLRTRDGGATWIQQGLVTPPESLDWVRCGSALACVAATRSGDQLLRTDDGGDTWTSISPATRALYAATYSGGAVVAVGDAGTTVLSGDAGHNFAPVSQEFGAAFTSLQASSSQVAYVAGRGGAIARTTDGGRSWSPLTSPVDGDLVDLAFPTMSTGFALAPHNVLLRTDDGGLSWRLLDLGTFVTARALVAAGPSDLIVVMQQRGLRRSGNGGRSFVRVRERAVAGLQFTGAGGAGGRVYAYGRRVIAISDDRGAHWRTAHLPERGKAVVSVEFATSFVAYALTSDGRLWRSVDGARSWYELAALGSEIATGMAWGSARSGYVAVPAFGHQRGGYLLHTSDGGLTWRPQLADAKPIGRRALAAAGDDAAFAVAGGNHVLATDRGGDIGQRAKLTLSVTRRRPGKPGVIAISGTLTPADGGEQVVVSKREGRSSRWLFRDVTVASNGRFTVFTTLTRTTRFVAQWAGDDDRAGAGTRVLTLGVGPKYTQRVFSARSQSG